MLQGNPGKENGVNVPNTNWKNSPNRNFTRHTKSDASHKGYIYFYHFLTIILLVAVKKGRMDFDFALSLHLQINEFPV